jgi:hypothetical protein
MIYSTRLENKRIQFNMIYTEEELGYVSLCSDKVTGWTGKESGFSSWQDQDIFFFSTASRLVLGLIQPPNQLILMALSPGVKWLEWESDHSPASNAKVKNGGAMPSFPHISSWCVA